MNDPAVELRGIAKNSHRFTDLSQTQTNFWKLVGLVAKIHPAAELRGILSMKFLSDALSVCADTVKNLILFN
ncbi:MAG: hypothetical protein ABIT08_14245 [Bacteroidia bacterium]